MDLTLFRHGIAVDPSDPLCPIDFERPLTLEGRHRTEAALRGLKAMGLTPTHIFTSPYKRCMQTARLAAQVFSMPKRALLALDSLRPEAEPYSFWRELERLAPARALVIGHGGSLEPIAHLALDPVPQEEGAEPALYTMLNLKKAGALHLDVALCAPPRARLQWLLTPKLLRQLGRT